MKKCGLLLRFQQFENQFGVQILKLTQLCWPPKTPAIPLMMWAKLYYSLRNRQGKDGTYDCISDGTVWQIGSATGMFYTLDMQVTYPQQMIWDSARRSLVYPQVLSWCDDPGINFAIWKDLHDV
jgi:hypothetical protein